MNINPALLRRSAAALVTRAGEYGDLFVETVRQIEVSRDAEGRGAVALGGWSGIAARRIDVDGGVRHHAQAGIEEDAIAEMPAALRNGGAPGSPSASRSAEAGSRAGVRRDNGDSRPPGAVVPDPGAATAVERYLAELEIESVGGSARAELRSQQVVIATSEGEIGEERRDWVAFTMRAVSKGRGGAPVQVVQGGGARDPDRLRALHPPADVRERLLRARREADEAVPSPSGETLVVLGPGPGGILFHEACGHALEGDRALRGRSVFFDLIGETVGPAELTLVDDPTLDGLPGSRRLDDEGWPATRTVLIDAGRVAGLLLDRATALRAGTAPTGSARRESYRDLPLPRMTNTFVLEGNRTPEEIVESVARGIYIEELGQGQVDTATADFVFQVRRGSLIAGGRRVASLAPCVVSGNGVRALGGLRMIGGDLRFDSGAGECGKEGQRARAAVGQPTVLIEGLLVRPAGI